jgi:hypothetical protein
MEKSKREVIFALSSSADGVYGIRVTNSLFCPIDDNSLFYEGMIGKRRLLVNPLRILWSNLYESKKTRVVSLCIFDFSEGFWVKD